MKIRPMKVLFIHGFDDNIAGQEVSLMDRLTALRDLGVTCEVLIPGRGVFCERLEGMGFRVHAFGLHQLEGARDLPAFSLTVARLARLLWSGGFSVAHCSGAYPHQYVYAAARLAGVPTVVHINTGAYTPRCYWANLVPKARKVVCVSEKVRTKVREVTGMSGALVVTVYDGVSAERLDATEPRREAIRREFGVPQGHRLVGQLATVIPRKGFDLFVEAAGKVAAEVDDVSFFVVGRTYGDAYEETLRRRVDELGLGQRLVFVGFQKAYPRYIDVLDISVLASRAEGLPRILVESQMMGKPVVGTAVDGIAETVRDHDTGLLVPPEDPDALAAAILELLRDPAAAAAMGERARAFSRATFGLKRAGEQLVGVYRELAG